MAASQMPLRYLKYQMGRWIRASLRPISRTYFYLVKRLELEFYLCLYMGMWHSDCPPKLEHFIPLCSSLRAMFHKISILYLWTIMWGSFSPINVMCSIWVKWSLPMEPWKVGWFHDHLRLAPWLSPRPMTSTMWDSMSTEKQKAKVKGY